MAVKRRDDVFETYIRAEPETVFDYVSDLARHHEWSGAPLRVEPVADETSEPGTRFRSVGRMMGREFENELRVVEREAPSRFVFIAQDPNLGECVHRATMNTLVIRPFLSRPMMNRAFKALRARLEQGGDPSVPPA